MKNTHTRALHPDDATGRSVDLTKEVVQQDWESRVFGKHEVFTRL